MKNNILQYLGIYSKEVSSDLLKSIDQGILDIQEHSNFKAYHQFFTLEDMTIKELNIQLNAKDLQAGLKDCHQVMISSYTLGIGLERYLKKLQLLDMTKAVTYDAIASAYLEDCADKYDESLELGKHTFRYAPGYGDIPLELNTSLASILDIHKHLGISVTDSGLFLPQKSMLCITGIGSTNKKTCGNCQRKEQCEIRKRGLRCYKTD